MTHYTAAYEFDLEERSYENASRDVLVQSFMDNLNNKKPDHALGLIMELLHRMPYSEFYKRNAIACLMECRIKDFNPALKQIVTSAMTSRSTKKERIFTQWQDLFHQDPLHKPFQDLIEAFEDGSPLPDFDMAAFRPAMADPFLQLGLQSMTMVHIPTEKALTALRRFLLIHRSSLQESDADFLCSLGLHNFYAEYPMYVQEDEKEALKALEKDLTSSTSPPLIDLALMSCYQPLGLFFSPETSLPDNNELTRKLYKVQIEEPYFEQDLKKQILSLSDIENTVSQNVREMYEQNPYPRWFDQDIMGKTQKDINGDILIAGCGTGNFTSQISCMYPNAPFTAVDLSTSSIAYARRKTMELGINNIDFFHGDILEISKLDRSFDIIECSGVLHHMQDPVAGWKALLTKLKPGGRMYIGLYSEIARQPIVKAREYIAELNYTADPDGIRQFRKDAMELDIDSPMVAITWFNDFFSLSECRDLVFHVQETRYTTLELKQIFEELDLHFLGFRNIAGHRADTYKAMFPDDPTFSNLENWHIVEQQNPEFFCGMYHITCCRNGEKDIPNDTYEKVTRSSEFNVYRQQNLKNGSAT